MMRDFLIVGVTLSLVVTEIALIVTLRTLLKELRGMRSDLPKMLGAFGGLSLLLEAYRTAKEMRR